ncbi:hypothetical protein IE53DRAFT_368189 [Violaceomyces palustris]|uniref:Uncharacterized protein n=1 Tax=Violaceomyces palustris TaxID=1673888 RepID=A0ACD0NZW5_9BASI|nr:hypothetical protein IE53DRAFT_368189 [Violaceomyces palustris]
MSHDPRHRSFRLEPDQADERNKDGRFKFPLASTAPVLQCYEEAVQSPLAECSNLDSLYSGAQLDDTDRYDARVLREDFCSTAIIATTWLAMSKLNRSQGVDIDLDALRDTQRRLGPKRVKVISSPSFSLKSGSDRAVTTEVEPLTSSPPAEIALSSEDGEQSDSRSSSRAGERENSLNDTWVPGAATERFDRKLAKKLEKLARKSNRAKNTNATEKQGSEGAGISLVGGQGKSREEGGKQKEGEKEKEGSGDQGMATPRMTLLHSDVLELPVPPIGCAERGSDQASALEAPDLIASLNYAMAYFHDRASLIAYLKVALKTLRPKTGVFITDMFGGPPTGETYPDQDQTWKRFDKEVGFKIAKDQVVLQADRPKSSRPGTKRMKSNGKEASSDGSGIGPRGVDREIQEEDGMAEFDEEEKPLEIFPAPKKEDEGTRSEWPRGKLKMVRTGTAHGGFQYWREDGPVDWMTNRFRMSLSFRFMDGSWLRDVFSYDFRIWSIKELTEAMEEVGFVRVKVHILPRNAGSEEKDCKCHQDEGEGGSCRCRKAYHVSESDSDNETEPAQGEDEGLANMAQLMLRTEDEEREKPFYRALKKGEKVFSEGSFGTYIVACAP